MAVNGYGLYRQVSGALTRSDSLIATRTTLAALLEDAQPENTTTIAIVILNDVRYAA